MMTCGWKPVVAILEEPFSLPGASIFWSYRCGVKWRARENGDLRGNVEGKKQRRTGQRRTGK